jgi:histidyl-tRNA synthetase
MLRPWWFPEYTPAQQRIFDMIVVTLIKHFERWNYQHIMTPAVEPVDILTRGGDIGDKQVYGLYGLAQWNEDTKDYALHFDLTVPFARYVLDHMNDLAFPFKRYQMQPVWRGERTKRGRYKEFRQFDVDTIRRSETDVGIIGDNQLSICKLLDDYFKVDHQTFVEKASAFADATSLQKIEEVLKTHDYTALSWIEWFEYLDTTIKWLKQFNVNVQYDMAIIRGHAYYTWTVVEFFLEDDMELWAIAWGGAYRGLTDFIDPKHSFSGVGCSISSRIMEVILSLWWTLQKQPRSYMVANFADTLHDSMDILHYLHLGWKNAELYPTPAKLWKQFEYADKKWISHVVIYGQSEKEKNSLMVKDLRTWTAQEYKRSYAAWCAVIHDHKILLVQAPQWHWSMPKWHRNIGETVEQCAYRELAEETWITSSVKLSEKTYSHSYFLDTKLEWKIVDYYIVSVQTDIVVMQPWEVIAYKRCTYKEATKLVHKRTQGLLSRIKNFV